MNHRWCRVCCTTHGRSERCPGELTIEKPERHGWRVNVETPQGIEAYGVLIAKADCGTWRARVMTYPNVLWAIPGGSGAMKFVADTPAAAERQAIEFVREHCRTRNYVLRNEVALSTPGAVPGGDDEYVVPQAATRVIRFLPIRFGVVNPSEIGGTGNLSATGLFVITNHPMAINTRLRLLLDVQKSPMTLTGDVRWMNEQPRVGRSPGMGIRLHSPPDSYADYVRKLSLPPVAAQA